MKSTCIWLLLPYQQEAGRVLIGIFHSTFWGMLALPGGGTPEWLSSLALLQGTVLEGCLSVPVGHFHPHTNADSCLRALVMTPSKGQSFPVRHESEPWAAGRQPMDPALADNPGEGPCASSLPRLSQGRRRGRVGHRSSCSISSFSVNSAETAQNCSGPTSPPFSSD